tara:strand:+ start:16422 stop:17093 length:672 start_codon:yes stop_codon:yes gene_type:complete
VSVEVKLVGTMSLFWFPLWEYTLSELARHVDELYIRVDSKADPSIPRRIESLGLSKVRDVLYSDKPWDTWTWQEEMMRMADRSEPDAVLSLDDDEVFSAGIDDNVRKFLATPDKEMMMFHYGSPLPTIDGVTVNNGEPYPAKPHARVYRWKPGITFKNYQSFNRASNLNGIYWCDTEIIHYSHFTEELRGDFWFKHSHARRDGHPVEDNTNTAVLESDGTGSV